MSTGQVDQVALGQRQVVGPGGLVVVQHHHWTDRKASSHCARTVQFRCRYLELAYLCPGSGAEPWRRHPQGAVGAPRCRRKLQSPPGRAEEEEELGFPDLIKAEEIFCEWP